MDADQLKCKWVQFKGALKTRWSRFRDQHLVQCEGSYAPVVNKTHERYCDKQNGFLKGGRSAASGVGTGGDRATVPPDSL